MALPGLRASSSRLVLQQISPIASLCASFSTSLALDAAAKKPAKKGKQISMSKVVTLITDIEDFSCSGQEGSRKKGSTSEESSNLKWSALNETESQRGR
jgi:hypothetical protein